MSSAPFRVYKPNKCFLFFFNKPVVVNLQTTHVWRPQNNFASILYRERVTGVVDLVDPYFTRVFLGVTLLTIQVFLFTHCASHKRHPLVLIFFQKILLAQNIPISANYNKEVVFVTIQKSILKLLFVEFCR